MPWPAPEVRQGYRWRCLRLGRLGSRFSLHKCDILFLSFFIWHNLKTCSIKYIIYSYYIDTCHWFSCFCIFLQIQAIFRLFGHLGWQWRCWCSNFHTGLLQLGLQTPPFFLGDRAHISLFTILKGAQPSVRRFRHPSLRSPLASPSRPGYLTFHHGSVSMAKLLCRFAPAFSSSASTTETRW